MSDSGWIKSYRKLKSDGWFKNLAFAGFWHWCLQSAAFKDSMVFVGMQRIHLKPGQFVFSYKIAMSETDVSMRTARTYIERLKNDKQIDIQTTNKYSIITIINWDTYQDVSNSSDKQTDKQTDKQPTSNRQTKGVIPIIEEYKEDKEVKEINIYARENAPLTDIQNSKKTKKQTETKTEYAPAVKMTAAEYDSFIAAYGDACPEMLEILSDYKLSTGKNYKSDRATMNTWVQKEFKKRYPKAVFPKDADKPQAKKSTGNPFADYALELEEQEKKTKPWN